MARDAALPRVWCDFNGAIDANTWPLTSYEVLESRGSLLRAGMRVVAYTEDAFEGTDEPAWMSCEAELLEMPGWGLAIKADPESFLWEPRTDETFRG
jgi:hypothetical protein